MDLDLKKHLRTLNGNDYFSQAAQDLFVLCMLENKHSGYYCEIGGADPVESNNTFLLEKYYSWTGVSIEFDSQLSEKFNSLRQNPCLNQDATKFDFLKYFSDKRFPAQIDYLSLDIEPAENTFLALQNLPFNNYRFSVITYEHDRHISGDKYMIESRKFLESRGYQAVVKNVSCFGRDFEDWWVDPSVIAKAKWEKFCAEGIEFSQIFKTK